MRFGFTAFFINTFKAPSYLTGVDRVSVIIPNPNRSADDDRTMAEPAPVKVNLDKEKASNRPDEQDWEAEFREQAGIEVSVVGLA